jgi:hypothetical protein
MPTFRQRFTGETEEDFPVPPIARRLQPGDVVEYDAEESIAHARLELLPEKGKKTAADPPASPDKE